MFFRLLKRALIGLGCLFIFFTVLAFIMPNQSSTPQKAIAPSPVSEPVKPTADSLSDNINTILAKETLWGHIESVEIKSNPKISKLPAIKITLVESASDAKNLLFPSQHDMGKIYYAVYSQIQNILGVIIYVKTNVEDKYGNDSLQQVYVTELLSNTANKINWQNDPDYLKVKIIPGLWHTDFATPEIRLFL